MFTNIPSSGVRWIATLGGYLALIIASTSISLQAQNVLQGNSVPTVSETGTPVMGQFPAATDKPLITMDDSSGGEVLSLRTAVQRTLSKNLGLKVEAFNQAIVFEDIAVEQAAFDGEIFANVNLDKQELATTQALTSGTKSDNRQYGAGIRKKISTGATAELSTGLTRRDSNAGVNFSSLDYSADITASITQPLLKGGWKTVNLAGLAKAKSRTAAARLQLKSTIAKQIELTENYYWNLSYAYANRTLSESSRKAALNLLKETEERQRVGLASDVDVLQARASLASREDAIVSATQQIEDAQDALARQIGMLELPEINAATATPPKLRVRELPETADAVDDFATVWNHAIVWDPDTGIQEEMIARNQIDQQVARNGLQPSLDLTLAGSLLGSDTSEGTSAYENAANNDGRSWRTGLVLSYPWGSRGERAMLRQAEKSVEQQKLSLIDHKQSLYQDVRSTWRQAEAAQSRLSYTHAALSLQERNYLQQEEKYRIGMATLREVIETQRDLDNARITRLNATLEFIKARTALSRLDGTILEQHDFSWDDAASIIQADSSQH